MCCGTIPNDGDSLCPACVSDLTKLLAELDSVVGELQAAVPRASLTASYGERVSSSGSLHAPLPINEAALDAHMALDKLLMMYAFEVAKLGDPLQGRDSRALSNYLFARVNVVRRQHWAPDFKRALEACVKECEQVTHRAAGKEFAGTCQKDGTNLYAVIGSDEARCTTCGTEYRDIQRWRDEAKRYAKHTDDDIIGYPQALSQHLNRVHGENIGADYIRVLANRGILKRHNPEETPEGKKLRPVYRLGDIKQLLNPEQDVA